MNWETIRILLRHELLLLVRDRRTLILSVALPIAIMPVMLFASRSIHERRQRTLETTTYKYAVTGEEAEKVRSLIAAGRSAGALESNRDPASAAESFRMEEVQVADPAASLRAKDIHFYVEAVGAAEADRLAAAAREKARAASAGQPAAEDDAPEENRRVSGIPLIRIYFQGDRDASESGRTKMRATVERARSANRDALLRRSGFPVEPRQVLAIEDQSLASAGQVTGSFVGRFLTVFLLMLMLSGGAVVAMDSIAGEKERGSLETLLTTAARRSEIVAAKQLSILAVALTITVIQIANILIYVTFRVIELPKNFVLEAPPQAVLTLLILFIPVAALVSAVLLMLSAYARTYKEAQLYFFPVYLVSLVPALAAVLPGLSLRSAIVAVPIANVSVAVREVLVGKYDWPMLLVTCAVMFIVSIAVIRASAKMLSKERLITASELDAADLTGGPALFPRHVLRWYAVMGALMLAVAANFPQMATFMNQILFNELVIFLLAPLLMIWKYRLNIREALALRPVKPLVWLGVLLAIPSGHLVGIAVFRLADLIFPVPQQVLEQFARDVLPKDMPTWQLFFFIAILPGICEEIGFRGTLLHGLRRRFHPAVLALVVGVIFGVFHIALFRIIPTAFLGVILTAIALLTGSIFPGMVIHAGNNGFALWASRSGFELEKLATWHYAAAAAIFALSFYIFYRARTPYPGLRG